MPAFNRVAPENGTPQELRDFVRQAHRLGMKVAIDLVVYGVHPDSEEVNRLPEDVWCVDEQGNRVKVWGGSVLAADVSHPVWQERIREVVTCWAKEYGFDGARLDVMGWGQAANWRNPHRANASVAYGGLQLNKVVRDAFRAVTRDGFILPEAGKPLAFRHADMLFDYPWYMVMRDLTLQPDLARWIREAQEWLEWERCCYPRRALNGLVRFLENHDTVPATQYFGVGISQALMAICCLMQGVPLIYQEQETGFSRDLSEWLHWRRREKCFAEGDAEYLSVRCSHPHVFTFLRRAEDGAAIVGVNLTGEEVRCQLSWERVLSQRFPVCVDFRAGKPVRIAGASAEVEISPYRPVVLLLKPRGWRTAPQPPHSVATSLSAAERWQILPDGTARALGAERWFVETPEGRLEDVFRAYRVQVKPGERLIDALPVLKRAWHPLEEGLLDGAQTANLGVVWADGRELCLSVDTAKAAEVRIEDRHLDGRQVDLVVKPREAYRLGRGALVPLQTRGMEVTPLFVHLRSGGFTLSLARRHGGLPAVWRSRDSKELRLQDGDLYTDWGLVDGGYASADGETNPRLRVEQGAQVHFTGWLRHRAWNGVQSCPVASPGTRYRLSYALQADGTLKITIGVAPQSAKGETRAFFALRLPLRGFRRWRRGSEGGVAEERTGVRLGEQRTDGSYPLIVQTEAGVLRVQRVRGLQNTFLIDSGHGEAVLFLALLDGEPVHLREADEWVGEVWLSFESLPRGYTVSRLQRRCVMSGWQVLVMAYGTPRTLDEVEPYYTHIRRGRAPSREQLEDLVRRYQAIGGVSPLNEITVQQAAAVEKALRQRGWTGQMYLGMKHWHPFIAEAVEQMARDGVQRAVGVVLAPHYSRMSIGTYIEYAEKARQQFAPGMELRYVERWGTHPLFIRAVAQKVQEALADWKPEETMVVFSAHSLPERIRQWDDPYERELLDSAQAVARLLELPNWTFAFQSASATGEPWLGPDILERIEEIAQTTTYRQMVFCAIGFVADHLEVLYDLDIEARQKCETLEVQYRRAASLNDDPLMAEAVADVVLAAMR